MKPRSEARGFALETILLTALFWITILLATGIAAALADPVGAPEITAVAEEDDAAPGWHQWRGPNRDGSVAGPEWPADLSDLQPVWRVELGKGYSGPIVTADKVFVVETTADKTARVSALRRDSGETIWSREWRAEGDVPFFANSQGTWERSTPAYDGDTLYVGDMREVLRALDGDTGEERWSIDFPATFRSGVPSFGFASSPMIDGDYLYVQASNALVKIDRRSGEIVWRSAIAPDSMMSDGAFSSPIIAEVDGTRQIVVFTRQLLSGVELETGRVLWWQEVPNFRGMNIVTPVVWDGGVFVSQYRNGSFFFRPRSQPGLAEESDGADRYLVEQMWTNKGSGYMSSPLVIDDHVYQHLGNGRLSSIDLRSGEENWRTRPLGEYWSMVRQGERILALDVEGTLRLVRANPGSFELIDEVEVAEQSTWGHLAVSGDGLFVRELEAISAFRWGASAVGDDASH